MSPFPPFHAHQELEFVLDLVRQCSPIALAYQAGGSGVLALRHKPFGGGPITAADSELNRRIVEALSNRFPDDAILAEESDDDGRWRSSRRCWHVDPIDGTREFARGRAGWTIQVGLCIEGDPVLGVIAEPGTRRLTWGLVDAGGCVAMQRLGDSPATPLPAPAEDRSLHDLILIGGTAYPLSRQHAIRRALEIEASRTLTAGSVGVRMTSVARGDADAYVQAPGRTKTWDTCAPEAVLRATGAQVTDLRGRALTYRGPTIAHAAGVIATSPALHAPILDRLAPLVERWLARP